MATYPNYQASAPAFYNPPSDNRQQQYYQQQQQQQQQQYAQQKQQRSHPPTYVNSAPPPQYAYPSYSSPPPYNGDSASVAPTVFTTTGVPPPEAFANIHAAPPDSNANKHDNVFFELPPELSSTSPTGVSPPNPPIMTTAPPPPAFAMPPQAKTSPPLAVAGNDATLFDTTAPSAPAPAPAVNTVPIDILASQELAMERAARRGNNRKGKADKNGVLTVHNPNSSGAIVVPKSRNPTGSDAIHPLKREMKQRRQVATTAGAVGGAIVGTVLLGPVMGPFGTVIGGTAGGAAYRQLSKVKERKAQRDWEKANFQRTAASRPGFQSSAFA